MEKAHIRMAIKSNVLYKIVMLWWFLFPWKQHSHLKLKGCETIKTRLMFLESIKEKRVHWYNVRTHLSEKKTSWQPCLKRSCFIGRRTYSYSEPQLYNQNSGGNYFDTQGGSAQVSTHSMANNGNGNGALAMGLSGGQIISSSGAYLIGGNSMDGSAPHSAAQTTRASPATVSSNHRRTRQCSKTCWLKPKIDFF